MKFSLEDKPLIFRAVLFIISFILVTGIIGPWVISTRLLYDFHFFIYGNLGKLVIFFIIAFFLLTREKITKIRVTSYDKRNLLWVIGAFTLIPVFFISGTTLLTTKSFTDNLLLSLSTHMVTISIPILLALGIFGLSFLRSFIALFKREILLCLGAASLLFLTIFQVWKLWPFFSELVLRVEYMLFSVIYSNVFIIPPRGLYVQNFAVDIGEACSGIESIFLFTVLYSFIIFIDWKKLDKKKAFLFYPFLLAGLIVMNILRVFLLILIGVLISPEVMATLFHTYLGMVLFIIYFLLFLKFGYGRIKKY